MTSLKEELRHSGLLASMEKTLGISPSEVSGLTSEYFKPISHKELNGFKEGELYAGNVRTPSIAVDRNRDVISNRDKVIQGD